MAQAVFTLMCLVAFFALGLNYAFEHGERHNWLLRRLDQRQRVHMLQDTERLQRLSTEDPLTALPNRRQFDADLPRAWARAAELGEPLSLVMLDVDHFKAYNDSHGHPQGDACLRDIAGVLARLAQAHHGVAARLGGEEFALLLPGLMGVAAAQVAQSLCEDVAALQRPHRASAVAPHVTISLGVAEARPRRHSTPDELVQAADAALYQAKDSGRNRVCLSPAVVQGTKPCAVQVARTSTVPTAAPVTAGDASTQLAVRRLQSLLDKGLWRLRFPGELEASYLQDRAESRRRHVRLSALVGLVLFNAYMFGNVAHYPDVPRVWLWALTALCVTMVGGVLLASRSWFSPWQREASYSVGVTVVGLASVWVLSHSQASTVWSFLNCMLLVSLFAGAAARLPFRFALPPSVLTVGAIATWFAPVGESARLMYTDSLSNIVNATLYPLVAAYTLDYADRKQWLLARIAGLQQAALAQVGLQLQQLSLTDALTGLPNRRQFELGFARLQRAAQRQGEALALLVIDVDHFKRYNDGHGHPAGDECLRQIAQALARVARDHAGLVARIGGEEFGLVLPCGGLQAQRAAEQVCAAVRALQLPHAHTGDDHLRTVTVSVGVHAMVPLVGDEMGAWLSEADAALYRAKATGRDRAVSADALQAQAAAQAQPA